MREIRYLDKLIDELAKGKAMDKILRNNGPEPPFRRSATLRLCSMAPSSARGPC